MAAMQGALSAAERSMRSVFVGNIPYEATEEQLKDIFAEVGPVVSFRLVYDRETGKPKGYGFCEYKDQEMALSAMRNLNSYELNGRALRVDNAASEKSKEELKIDLQASLGGPPVESPYGPEVAAEIAPDTIAKVMCSLPPEQLNDLMQQMKECVISNPNEARNLLIQNPQLAYALLQALVSMKSLDMETAKTMLHPEGYIPTVVPLRPSPDQTVCIKNEIKTDVPTSYPAAMPPAQMQQNPGMMTQPRPNQPMGPLSRPALLGERPTLMNERNSHMNERLPLAPGPTTSMLQHPFPERDPRGLGDHDLRHMPMSDRDMRAPPMLIGDKDMRQPAVGDQDLRAMAAPVGLPDNRSFDPRYRNVPGPAPGSMADNRAMIPPDGRGTPAVFDRPHPGSSPYEGRVGPQSSPVNSAMTGPRAPQNPRVSAVGSGSPAVGSNSPNPNASPRASNPLAAAAAAIAPHDREKAALIMQVLQLSDQQIAMLPPEQRQSIMILKEQIARSQQS